MISSKKELIERLRKLGNGVIHPKNINMGLCEELDDFQNRTSGQIKGFICYVDIMLRFAPMWPLYSGRILYPVPSHVFIDCKLAYQHAINLWDSDEYGNNRRNLCLFLANELERRRL